MARKRAIRGVRDVIPGGYVLGRMPGKGKGAVTIIPFTPNAQGGVGGGGGGGGASNIAVEMFGGSIMRANEIFGQIIAPVELTLPANLPGSYAKAVTASTGTVVLSIRKATAVGGIGAEIGTITFTTSATGVIVFAADVAFAIGDRLLVTVPSPADGTLSDTTILLYGSI